MIREFRKEDLQDCMNIVNEIWKFSDIFTPKELSACFLYAYTVGSLLESNFTEIIEEDNDVVGFLFGRSERRNSIKKNYSALLLKIKMVMSFIKLKNVSLKQRYLLLNTVRKDEINRRKAEQNRKNEITLFAVKANSQRKGYGHKLIKSFIDHCRKNNINRIVLDTDEQCNYVFYNHLGFTKIAEYYSPLLELYTKKSGNSYVYELIIEDSI